MSQPDGSAQMKELSILGGHEDSVWCVAWSADGKLLASCGTDKSIRVWARRGDDWALLCALEDGHSRTIRSVCWSACGRYLLSASFDGTCVVWRMLRGAHAAAPLGSAVDDAGEMPHFDLVATLEGHENEVKCVAWCPAEPLVATCGRDKSVWLWGVSDDGEFDIEAVLHGHTQDVKHVAFHPTRPLLVSTSYDNTFRAWACVGDDWRSVSCVEAHSSTVWAAAFSPDGAYLATCSEDRSVAVWRQCTPEPVDTDTDGPQLRWEKVAYADDCADRYVYSVHWQHARADDGGDRLLAIASGDNSVRLLALRGGSLVKVGGARDAHVLDANCVRWHPTEPSLLASAGDDAAVKLWRVKRAGV